MWKSNPTRSKSPELAPSVYSKDISLGENYGQSMTFTREVKIAGWTNVGDKPESSYICKPVFVVFLLKYIADLLWKLTIVRSRRPK
jgi:hypothetical protein